MPQMTRLIAPIMTLLTLFFAALMFLIMPLAPETAVVGYSLPAPERQEAIWLMDIRSGLAYFSGVTYRTGNLAQWTPDGNAIATLNFFTTPTQFELVYLDGRAPQSVPLQSTQPNLSISRDGTKMIYRSAESDGSLNMIDFISGEETTLVADLPVTSGSWMEDGERILFRTSDGGSFSNAPFSLYTVDINTAEVTPLFENIETTFSTLAYDPMRLIYLDANELWIASAEAPDEPRLITTFDLPTVRSFYFHPQHDDQLIVTLINEGVQEIWLVNIDSGERELLHAFEISNSSMPTFRFSPDGMSLVKLTELSAQATTLTISKGGQPDYDVTVQGEYQFFGWSPDGRYLAVYTQLNAINRYFLVDTVDATVRLLDVKPVLSLLWQPEAG